MQINSRPWNNIIEHYSDMVANGWRYEPMLNLVQTLAASPYVLNPPVTVLYPATSMDVLIIATTNPFEWKSDVLEIRYLAAPQNFQFEFWESPYISEHWHRISNIGNGFVTLERFLHLKGWA